MDISSIASASASLATARTGDAVATLVFRKALDAEAQGALQMLAALPPVNGNPPHLGQRVDTFA